MDFGAKISNHPYIDVLSGSAQDIVVMLNQIKLPFQILGYSIDKGTHYVIISLTKPLRKITKNNS